MLPTGKYPEREVAENPLKWVLACRSCNMTKGSYNVSGEGADPQEALINDRIVLIKLAATEIQDRLISVHDRLWETAKRILLGHPWT